MATARPRWPTEPRTLFFNDVASQTTLSKALRNGRIRRLAPRTYTADLDSPDHEIVRANWSLLCGHFLPGAVIVDRSAATSEMIFDEALTVATDNRTTSIKLPGLEIRVRPGTPYESDSPWTHGLFMSSPARTLIDNLESSRSRGGRPSRTLSLPELEDWVARKYIAWGAERTDRLRMEARDLATTTGRGDHIDTIDTLFGQLTGAAPVRPGAGQLFKAVVAGGAWDERRIRLFEQAADALQRLPPGTPEWLPTCEPPGELPFYESYFSNYIEGTTFLVEEARQIIETGTPLAERPADGHDLLGTYRCVADPTQRAATSIDPDELIGHLIARHQEIMRGRPDKRPGAWKNKNNQVGTYQFVDKDLVEGTLSEGLEQMRLLPEGLARALYVMIVISEVHPFLDGNGRVARVMMNAELSSVGAARIVIPSVYRNEYLTGLRRVSITNGDVAAYVRIMTYAWRWSAAMPWSDPVAAEGQLRATNALLDSTEAEARGVRLELP